jgi:tRNA A-37 threonylcarbamoyl transferase component Bud32
MASFETKSTNYQSKDCGDLIYTTDTKNFNLEEEQGEKKDIKIDHKNIQFMFINKKFQLCKNYNLIKTDSSTGSFGKVYHMCCLQDCNYVIKLVDFIVKPTFETITPEKFMSEICIQNEVANIGLTKPIIQSYITNEQGAFIMESLQQTVYDYIINNIQDEKKKENVINECLSLIIKLHTLNIYHGDCHLENFMIDKNNKIYMIDFGYSGHLTEQNKLKYVSRDFSLFMTSINRIQLNKIFITNIKTQLNHQINKINISSDIKTKVNNIISILNSLNTLSKTELNNEINRNKYENVDTEFLEIASLIPTNLKETIDNIKDKVEKKIYN